ncbi:MAG: sialidase family protein [Mycobacteriales bacterium]|nr:glycoside hydrolase [Frankia sp.]
MSTRRFLAAVTAALGAGALATLPTPTVAPAAALTIAPPRQVWNKPVMVHRTLAHRETSLALDPVDPNMRFICDPSGVPQTDYNQSYFHVSKTAGKLWSPLRVETSGTDTRSYAFEGGDCDVAFDAGGTMYSADTWLGDLSVGHSLDRGDTWSGTSLAVTSPIVDRPWLVGGPKGTIHVSYQDVQCCMPSAIWYTRSTDFGETFAPAVPVTGVSPDGAYTWEGNYVVSPEGDSVYLVYTRRLESGLANVMTSTPETVWVAISHDSGLTWTQHLVASMPDAASYLYPSIAMDAGGFLHVVFASKTETDQPVWYALSTNHGDSWSTPTPLMRKVAAYGPWVAGGRKGEAAIVWYGSPNPKATETTDTNWYFYWARVTGAGSRRPEVTGGRTTRKPIFSGRSGVPEFEMVRLDRNGLMHLGMSAYWNGDGKRAHWAVFYQSQAR